MRGSPWQPPGGGGGGDTAKHTAVLSTDRCSHREDGDGDGDGPRAAGDEQPQREDPASSSSEDEERENRNTGERRRLPHLACKEVVLERLCPLARQTNAWTR